MNDIPGWKWSVLIPWMTYQAGPGHAKTCLMPYANNKGADHPSHPRSRISTFVVRCLDSMKCILALSKVSRFQLVSVAEQAGLNLTWSKISEDTFSRDVAQADRGQHRYHGWHSRLKVVSTDTIDDITGWYGKPGWYRSVQVRTGTMDTRLIEVSTGTIVYWITNQVDRGQTWYHGWHTRLIEVSFGTMDDIPGWEKAVQVPWMTYQVDRDQIWYHGWPVTLFLNILLSFVKILF